MWPRRDEGVIALAFNYSTDARAEGFRKGTRGARRVLHRRIRMGGLCAVR